MADAGRVVKRATYEREYQALTSKTGAIRTICDLEGSVLCGIYHPGYRRLRLLLRSIWTDRPARSHDHPDRSQARLLFSMALRFAFAASSLDGDAISSHRPSCGDPGVDSLAVSFRRRREELEAPADCGPHCSPDFDYPRIFHPARAIRAVESAHECVERGSCPDRFVKAQLHWSAGALVFQVKQCRNCHSLGKTGGKRGPALDAVAVRLTQDQLVRQVIQGGGNMPAYGKNLSPAETTALVAFLETLHPQGKFPRGTPHVT